MRVFALLLGIVFASPVLAHGGGTNKCGCHFNRKTGECHCHNLTGACGCECQPTSCGGTGLLEAKPTSSQVLLAGLGEASSSASCNASGNSGFTYVAKGGSGHVRVRSYTTKTGKHVESHERSAPNGSKRDNWSTRGNVNPHTGKEGTKDPGKK